VSPVTVGLIGIGALLLLLFLRMPIGFVMALVGFAGFSYMSGLEAGLGILDVIPYRTAFSYTLCVLPLFVLMGQFAYYSQITGDLYDTMHKWLGHLPGGLASATVAGCAVFAAVSGSSSATAATIGTVALPQMQRYKYDTSLAAGAVAAGGTLGILIPPSLGFILYGVVTEESIGKLFIAGILPGILLALLFMICIYILVRVNPKLGPPGPKASFKERLVSIRHTWSILFLFLLIMGGIYTGIFTPTEAGAIGAFGAFIIGLARRRLTWQGFVASLLDTGRITAMIFILIIGAMIFSSFLTKSTIVFEVADLAAGIPVSRHIILVVILIFYLILGSIMDVASGLLITLPIFYPVVMNLGFDSVWFGVIAVVMFEAGLITPPVGLNVFVVSGVAKDIPLYTIFRGIVPFLIAILVSLVILIAFPQIATFLPSLM
jgi:C4-dicarboxylate transporter DctM subunit